MIAAFHAGILIAILCPPALAIETLRRAVPKTRPGHSSQVRYRYQNPEGRDSVPESCGSETARIHFRPATVEPALRIQAAQTTRPITRVEAATAPRPPS